MSKVLGEFLQEQQEPFTLELYLLERGQFRSKHLVSDGDFRCCSINSSTKFLKRSASCGGEKRRKVILKCSKIIKSVFNNLVAISHNQKKNLASEQHNNATTKNTNIADDDKFSSASSTTVFNSCSDISHAEEADNSSSPQAADGNCLHEKQVTEDRRKLRLDFLEESKQLSPVSVLEETESSDDDSPNVKKQECHKAKKQEEFSTPSVSNSWEKSPESQYIKNKKAMQQSRQLLFDCVKEVVENQKRKEEFQRILGAEQLWGLLLQNIMLWSQDSINETSINHLMHFDLLNSFEESSGIEEKWEIGKVVGDLIFVDISNEIALDMLNSSSSR
ncbi:uncharacterized protein LOC132033496 isoform X2 [Lycium ferocissimum]|uniref:uncharacterized protein LOC132033496 isoform X2 n=1 Tax=Lycium ferocissimum TaxID=112874 RepID=UPI0028154C3C|nr:uncharacterized protein LOC132033496 isoform X2 [Lycium ferocissimum]